MSDSGRRARSRAPTASSVSLDHARGRARVSDGRPQRSPCRELADEIEAAHAQVGQHRAHLRQIADGAVAALRRAAEHAQRARARRQQAENGAHQRGLAGAVRPEHADEFAGADGEACVGQHGAAADASMRQAWSSSTTSSRIRARQRLLGVVELRSASSPDRSYQAARSRSRRRPGSWRRVASSTRCCTILSEACLL